MKRLTLVRHAQAEWKDTAVADFARQLTRRGRAEAADIAHRLAADGRQRPDLIVTSPAARAAETAAVLARELALADRLVKPIDRLYLAPPDDLLAIVRETGPRVEHLMLVGHNPGLSDFARALSADATLAELATAASCAFTFHRDDWTIDAGAGEDMECDAPGRFFDLWH